jgi:hypothetical protein
MEAELVTVSFGRFTMAVPEEPLESALVVVAEAEGGFVNDNGRWVTSVA